jgi:hypothetical protein
MKCFIFAFLVLTFTYQAFAEVPDCTPEPDSTEVREDEVCRITYIKGSIAKVKWDALSAPEVAPRPNTFPQDYINTAVILAKYTDGAVCWKIQRPLYYMINGQQVYQGPQQCVHYNCNLIETK